MNIIIVLKSVDAQGLGGNVLEEIGMSRSPDSDVVFSAAIPSDSEALDSESAKPYTDALLAYGIKPVRVFSQDPTGGVAPITG